MTSNADNIFWPLRGFFFFVLRPTLWLGPIIACLFAWLLTFIAAGLIFYFTCPDAQVEGWWDTSVAYLGAIAYASIGFATLWMLAIPFILSIAYEKLILHIFKQTDVEQESTEHFMASIGSSLLLLVRGLPWRIGWLIVGIGCSIFFPPAAIIVTAIGLGHITLLDAADTVLGVQGKSGKQRRLFFSQYRIALLSAGIIAGILSALLSLSIIGLLFFLPSITCAAALCLPHWTINEPS